MLPYYYTVNHKGKDEINIQKSRFIGYVRRVESEEEAQQFIQYIKKKHHDANHNCSCYMIGENNQIQKANDDGEPSGTAGVPMLEVLKKQNLKDTAVVVTRYFGGIKLGAGGLIRAYGSTTSQAIKTTGIVKRVRMQGFSVTVDYNLLGKLENALRQSDHIIDTINYLENVELIIYTELKETENFEEWIINLTSDQAKIKLTDQRYVEINVDSTSE